MTADRKSGSNPSLPESMQRRKPFPPGGGQITESRLLLMSALMLADKLDEAEAAASQASLFSEMDPAEAESLIENASARLEALQGAGEKAD